MLFEQQYKSKLREMEGGAQTDQDYDRQGQHPFTYPYPIFLKPWCLYAKRRGIHSESQDEEYHQPKLISTIRTIQQFYMYYTSIKLPSECDIDVKIMIFQEGCKPSWEAWEDSGSLLLQFKESKEGGELELLDQVWEYLVFSMIGNRLDEEVIGICMNKHQKQTLIQIWLRRLHRKIQIGLAIEKMINSDMDHVIRKLKKKVQLKCTQHRESIKSQSTMKFATSLRANAKSLSVKRSH